MKTVADIVDSFPAHDKTAMIHKTGVRTFKLSYKELHAKVLQTAAFLEEQGLKKGDTLLLWGFNSPSWGVVFLAAAYKGIVIVPIDFLAVTDFVQKIQEQVNAKAIFHSEFKLTPNMGIDNFVLEQLDTLIHNVRATKQKTLVKPDDWLEIVYTSGTTGDPKGVIITHRNLVSNVTDIKKVVNPQSSQTFLSMLPLSHLFEQNPGFLTPLSTGCTIVYMRGLRPNLIFKVLAEECVTNIVLVPRLLKLFETSILREVEAQGKTKVFKKLIKLQVPRGVKKLLFGAVHKKFGRHFLYFVTGGAPISNELQQFWTGLGFRLVQGYGLTETAPVLTVNALETSVAGSVGHPIPGVKLLIHTTGEVYAKGPNITQGYFKKPQKTKELFDNGWLKTGDIGTLDKNGYLFLKGRQKDVIVTGAGMNIYPEDIETALLAQAGLKDVCVIGLPSTQGEQVHAELLLADPKADIKKIISAANAGLNDSQKITSHGVWLHEDFPRTTTMKIKKPLVVAEVSGREVSKLQKPHANTGSKLYGLIARVCDVPLKDVHPKATMASDLHLTSVNRIELVALLEQEFNLDINEDEITANTTVGQLEAMVKKRERVHEANMFRRWLLWFPVRLLRGVFNEVLANNLLRLFVRRKIIGKENLNGLNEPVIFIANHVGYFDAPTVLMSLPWRIRHRIAPAAWKEYFESEGQTLFKSKRLNKALLSFYYQYASVMVNAYPFPKKSGFKRSLEYTGELIDKKWNILFFPEGEHSPSGELQPFRSGIGWIVKEMKVPVVPIKHAGFETIMAGDAVQLPRFGKVSITIGEPLIIDTSKSITEITQELQDAVAHL